MRYLVCGGRKYSDAAAMSTVLHSFVCINDVIIAGEAPGADTLAREYAEQVQCGYSGFPADWEKHGKSAGVLRNIQMLVEGKPDMVIAFPGGKGTEHMIFLARKDGIPVLRVIA